MATMRKLVLTICLLAATVRSAPAFPHEGSVCWGRPHGSPSATPTFGPPSPNVSSGGDFAPSFSGGAVTSTSGNNAPVASPPVPEAGQSSSAAAAGMPISSTLAPPPQDTPPATMSVVPSTAAVPPTPTVQQSTSAPAAPAAAQSPSSSAANAAPAPSSASPAAGAAITGSTTATCEGESAACVGDVTHWDGGLGACGNEVDTETEYAIALPAAFMGPLSNTNPYCGRSVTLYNPNTGTTVGATVQDKCEGCVDRAIDCTDILFNAITDNMGNGRYHGIVWWLN